MINFVNFCDFFFSSQIHLYLRALYSLITDYGISSASPKLLNALHW